MTTLSILNNKKCQVISENKPMLAKLRKHLSFRLQGIEYSPAYRAGEWNGMTYLMSEKTNKFDLGLLEYVKQFLYENSIEYTFEDQREKAIDAIPISIEEKLKLINMIPRDYQREVIENCALHSRGIIRVPTGGGKTGIIALLTAKINKPTVIYVIGIDLLNQFHSLFSTLFDEPIGFVGNGVCNIQRITIASVWSAAKALDFSLKDYEDEKKELSPSEQNSIKIKEMIESAKLVVYDECHAVVCSSIQSIYKKSNAERMYGFSGTPYRDDGTDLVIKAILGEPIFDISASELITKGFLTQPVIKFVSVPKQSIKGTYQEVYKEYVVENDVRNQLAINELKKLLAKNYTPLLLFRTINHGKILKKMIDDEGIICEMLSGEDSLEERLIVKSKIEKKEIQCILASTIFDIGVDIPILDALILCGPNKGRVKTYQRIGRVIRKYPGKTIAAVVDFYDQVKFLKNHSLARRDAYLAEKGFRVISSKDMPAP